MMSLFETYYENWLNISKWECFYLGISRSHSQDILQDVLLEFLCHKEEWQSRYFDINKDNDKAHLFYLIRMIIKRRCKDFATRNGRYQHLELVEIDSLIYSENTTDYLSDEDFDKLRMVSKNVRCDDLVDIEDFSKYYPVKSGWVSGYVWAETRGENRYASWKYSAFVGSRAKGETPKRIGAYASRHKAYIALMNYNKKMDLEK